VVNHLVYAAFGRVTRTASRRREPAVDSLFLLPPRAFDADTGLQNNLHRWYDPGVGRRLCEDAISYKGGVNLYEYVANWPLKLADPYGLWPGGAPGGGAMMPRRFGTFLLIRPGAPPVGLLSAYGPGSFWPYPPLNPYGPGRLPYLPTMPTPPQPCAGYDRFVGSTCTQEDECGKKMQLTDPYPAKAEKVCERFIDMYNYSASSVCVAHCLISFEGTITKNTSCSERNTKRLNAHVWCYAVCGFVPDKGMPPGGADLGWEKLLADWWNHWGGLW